MSNNVQQWIETLEAEWDKPDGFLIKAREGIFDPEQAEHFIDVLKSIQLPEGDMIDRKLVSLLWFIPIFLKWQDERVEKKGGDIGAYVYYTNQIVEVFYDILGLP